MDLFAVNQETVEYDFDAYQFVTVNENSQVLGNMPSSTSENDDSGVGMSAAEQTSCSSSFQDAKEEAKPPPVFDHVDSQGQQGQQTVTSTVDSLLNSSVEIPQEVSLTLEEMLEFDRMLGQQLLSSQSPDCSNAADYSETLVAEPQQPCLETSEEHQAQTDFEKQPEDCLMNLLMNQSCAENILQKKRIQVVNNYDVLGKVNYTHNLILLRRHLIRYKRKRDDFNVSHDKVRTKNEIERCQRIRDLALQAWNEGAHLEKKSLRDSLIELIFQNWSNITDFGLDFLSPQILAMACLVRSADININIFKRISKPTLEVFLKKLFQTEQSLDEKHVSFMQKLLETKNFSTRNVVAYFIIKHYYKTIPSATWDNCAAGRLKELILQVPPDQRQYKIPLKTPRAENPPGDEDVEGTDLELTQEEIEADKLDSRQQKRLRKRENKDHIGEQSKKRKTVVQLFSAGSQIPKNASLQPSSSLLKSSKKKNNVLKDPVITETIDKTRDEKNEDVENITNPEIITNSVFIKCQNESSYCNNLESSSSSFVEQRDCLIEELIVQSQRALGTINGTMHAQVQTLNKQMKSYYNDNILSLQNIKSNQERLINILNNEHEIVKNLEAENAKLILELKNRDETIVNLREQMANDAAVFEEEKAQMAAQCEKKIAEIQNNFEKMLSVKDNKIQQALQLLQE